jgi:predicted phage tail protein
LKITRRSITFAVLGALFVLTVACAFLCVGFASAQASDTGRSPDVMVISGLPDFQALAYGKNTLSIAAVPVSQQDGKISFKATAVAASYPGNAPAVVYTLSEPMPGTLDLAQKTLQIDMGNFNTAASQAEHIDKSRLTGVLQTTANTTILEVPMDYKSLQGSEAVFRASGINVIRPDGQTQAVPMELPKQLIIDGDSKRLYIA